MAKSQKIDCIDELKELHINDCEQVNSLMDMLASVFFFR